MNWRRGAEGGELSVEEGERWGGEGCVFELWVRVGQEQAGDRVLAGARNWRS